MPFGRDATKLTVRKYRFQRQSADMGRDILYAVAILGAVAVMASVWIYGVLLFLSAPSFGIREVAVRGCRTLAEKDVLTIAGYKPRQNLFAANLGKMAHRIGRNPWIQGVSIGREIPDRLVIEIRERQPIALIKEEELFWLLDAEGRMFKRMENDDDLDLPVVTGCRREGRLDPDLLARSVALLHFFSQEERLPGKASIAELHGDPVFGFSLFTGDGLCLCFGFDKYEEKLARLTRVLDDMDRRKLRTRFLRIDLRHPNKITVERNGAMQGTKTPATGSKEIKL